MPRIQRRESQRRATYTELDEEQVRHLLWGQSFFGDAFPDEESFRAAWEMHRDELTAIWISDWRADAFASCGQLRPAAWWICDHGEERPVIGTYATPEHVANLRRQSKETFYFLHTSIHGGRDFSPLQEPEADYLRRLNLLTDEEREFLDQFDNGYDSDDE